MGKEEEVRASFAEQAFWCERLGSPFTALLCETLGRRLDRGSAIGRRVLAWPGEPRALGDALALRLCAGLHFMVRAGRAPDLAALYPPASRPGEAALWTALAPFLDDAGLEAWLDSAPQTNEVGRAAVLMSGLLVVAARFGLPIGLHELGASAGLNLLLDHYLYDLGGLVTGDRASAVLLKPEWEGPAPPDANVRIAARAGVDLNPPGLPQGAARLPAFLWPDQPGRLARLEAALAIAAEHPPRVDRADAADWIEAQLDLAPAPNVARVVLHSVAFQYFGGSARQRIARHIETAGEAAHAGAPLAWLRFEKEPDADRYALRLRTWPGGDELLAWTHPHGSSITWLTAG